MLVRENKLQASRLEMGENSRDFGDDDRRQSLRRLVQEQGSRSAQERSSDRDLLLLSTGKNSCMPPQQLFDRGEKLVDIPFRSIADLLKLCEAKVLIHGEFGQELPPLRN